MKGIVQYIQEKQKSEEDRAIDVIDKIASDYDEHKKVSASQCASLRKALAILDKVDSFEDGWRDIANNILSKMDSTPDTKEKFKELTIDCGYAKGKMFDYAGRKIVLIDIHGVAMPFYLSTGEGGKERYGIASGKWYPFFGIQTTHIYCGWLRKGDNYDIMGWYDTPIFKEICEYLDKKYGDIRKKDGLPQGYTEKENKDKFNKFAYAINKSLVKLIGSQKIFDDFDSISTLAEKINELCERKKK